MKIDGKKVSVKFTGRIDKKRNSYSIYARVVFNMKSTRFSIFYLHSFDELLESENQIKELKSQKFISDWSYFISKIVEYEYKNRRENFSVIGLGNKIENYQYDLLTFTIDILEKHLYDDILPDILTYRQYNNVDLLGLTNVMFHFMGQVFYIETEYNVNVIDKLSPFFKELFLAHMIIGKFGLTIMNIDTAYTSGKHYPAKECKFTFFDWLTDSQVKNNFIEFVNKKIYEEIKLETRKAEIYMYLYNKLLASLNNEFDIFKVMNTTIINAYKNNTIGITRIE